METIIIILVIFWVVVPYAIKKKQQQAKQEAERQRAARASTQKTTTSPQQRVQQPMRTTPLAPTARTPLQASYEGTGSQEGYSGPVLQGEQKHDVKSDLSTAKSTLKEARTTITHTVTVSSESGHAHEETSASGVAEDCPPEKAAAKPSANAAHGVGETAFVWSAAAVRNGLVMAEILGPCLANRD